MASKNGITVASFVKTLAAIKCWNVNDTFNPSLSLDKIKNEPYKWDDQKRPVRPIHSVSEIRLVSETIKNFSHI